MEGVVTDHLVKRWRVFPHDGPLISKLERQARIPPIIAQLLICRGVSDPEQAKVFLDAPLNGLGDPELIPGIDEAAECIYRAVSEGRRVVVYGDYDADGMTGSAIVWSCLRLLGADVSYYVPNRLEEGYGLHGEALEQLAKRGAHLVVSVDCGIASIEAAEVAGQLGLELVITDHHEPGDRLPRAAAIAHPRLPGRPHGFEHLCGAGVAFKLAWALCCRASNAKKVSDRMRSFLLSAIGLAAIGTVADVVPLLGENRILVRHGLNSLQHRPPAGIRALSKLMELDKKPSLSSEDIAFGMAPRLNAAGRLGQAQLGIELLVTESAERAQTLAEYIHQLNKSRESLERSVYLAANKQIKEHFDAEGDPAFVLNGTDWHLGVIGIVAGRLAEKYHRPVVLVSFDAMGKAPGVGSARSVPGFDLYQALNGCAECLVSFGGHAAAAGLKVDRDRLDAFRAAFCEHVADHIATEHRTPEIAIDAEAPLSQLTLKTVQQIEELAPFGAGNPRPVFCATAVELATPPKHLGSDRHLTVRLKQHDVTLRAVAFGHGDWLEPLSTVDRPLDVAYRPVINDFRGRRSVELHLVDWRITQRAALPVSSPS